MCFLACFRAIRAQEIRNQMRRDPEQFARDIGKEWGIESAQSSCRDSQRVKKYGADLLLANGDIPIPDDATRRELDPLYLYAQSPQSGPAPEHIRIKYDPRRPYGKFVYEGLWVEKRLDAQEHAARWAGNHRGNGPLPILRRVGRRQATYIDPHGCLGRPQIQTQVIGRQPGSLPPSQWAAPFAPAAPARSVPRQTDRSASGSRTGSVQSSDSTVRLQARLAAINNNNSSSSLLSSGNARQSSTSLLARPSGACSRTSSTFDIPARARINLAPATRYSPPAVRTDAGNRVSPFAGPARGARGIRAAA